MVAEKEITDFILEVFEEQEESFFFPVTSQKEARAFVKALHIKGVEYNAICQEIGEFEHNFTSWKKGLGRPGVGNRIIEMINKPLQEMLFSDEEDDDDDDDEDAEASSPTKEVKVQGTPKPAPRPIASARDKPMEKDMTDSWISRVNDKMKDIEITKKGSSSESESEESEEEKPQADSKLGGHNVVMDEVKKEEKMEESSEDEQKTEEEDVSDDEEEETDKVDGGEAEAAVMDKNDNMEKEIKETIAEAKEVPGEDKIEEAKPTLECEVKVSEVMTNGEVKKDTGRSAKGVSPGRERLPSEPGRIEKDFISSDSSSVMGTEITENYDSDLDLEGLDPNSDSAVLVRRVASSKAELSDGPGYIYVFTDSASHSREHRIKVGASRFPNKRLEQAMHYNISIKLVSAVAVSTRRAALRDIHAQLKGSKVEGFEDWFEGPLDTFLSTVSEVASNFTPKSSDC